MTGLIVLLCVILLLVVIVQVARMTELAGQIKGEEAVLKDNSFWNGLISIVFLIVFMVGVFWSAWHYRNVMLGYGPLESASAHGGTIDNMMNVTLFFTGIVFVLTHIALFYCVYKYRYKKDRKAKFISHDNKLEIVWTAIPAVVMAVLVVQGLNAWNTIMADIEPGEDYIEIEAMGQQFNWLLRYPGPDGKLGARDYRLTSGMNPIGQDWSDPKNHDDFHPDKIVLPVGKKVRVRILAKDVLHNFYLPQFHVKMDAVPGMPTYFVFTPIKTTAEFKQGLSKYPEWNTPSDPKDPSSPPRWTTFDYELACAELCGKGHYSMRRVVEVVSEAEYEAWLKEQKSYYKENIQGKDGDPMMAVKSAVESHTEATHEKEAHTEEAHATEAAH